MSFPFKEYKNKGSASKQPGLLCNREITKYFVVSDHQQFLDTILSQEVKNFYELIKAGTPVPPFFDIELYKSSAREHFDDNGEKIIQHIVDTLVSQFDAFGILDKRIITEAHNETKKSYHMVLTFKDADGGLLLFKDVAALKDFIKHCKLDTFKDSDNKYIIDPSVYREGLFRTIHSSKQNENRPLIKSTLSDEFTDIESFVSWYSTTPHQIFDWAAANGTPNANYTVEEPDNATETIDEDLLIVNDPVDLDDNDRKIIKKYVQKEYHHLPNKIREIIINTEMNCIIVALTEKYCPFVEREHQSNHQYIIIDVTSSKQKCYDTDCNDKKHDEKKLEDYPTEISMIIKNACV